MAETNMIDDENSEGLLKLFVGGLNYLSLRDDIKSYFQTFGKVQSCSLLMDKVTGKSRGFAFVSIKDPKNILEKKILSRKHEINGKIVDVKPAVEGKKREEMMDSSKKIFVGGLEPSVTEKDLIDFFSKYGKVKDASVLFDNNRNASRGFGFVSFEDKDVVDKLVKENNFVLKSRKIDVKRAQPKSEQKTKNILFQSGVDVVLNNPKYILAPTNLNTFIEPKLISFNPVGNLIFCRDQQITTKKGVVIGRTRSSQRAGEHIIMKQVFENLNSNILGILSKEYDENAFLEGGDFFVVKNDFSLLGVGLRTSMKGAAYLMEKDFLGTRYMAIIYDDEDMDQQRMHWIIFLNFIKI
jgi:RNA recognition motif-containing protein